mmetsp:Transcript_60711/g.109385  ORF Transcript_60711/g.109385 Transcript_60711/m.109385 type:complete len:159 (+) Transcript_60711:59-535(+)
MGSGHAALCSACFSREQTDSSRAVALNYGWSAHPAPVLQSNAEPSCRWAANLLANPKLRNKVCDSAFRKFDVSDTGAVEGQQLEALCAETCSEIGLPHFDASLLQHALASLGKAEGQASSREEFSRFYEKSLELFVAQDQESGKTTFRDEKGSGCSVM